MLSAAAHPRTTEVEITPRGVAAVTAGCMGTLGRWAEWGEVCVMADSLSAA